MTTITYSPKTKHFLESDVNYTSGMEYELATAVMEQYGGEEKFLAVWEDAKYRIGGTEGWEDSEELVKFFAKNRKLALSYLVDIAEDEERDSVTDLVMNFGWLHSLVTTDDQGKTVMAKFTIDDVSDAIYNSDAEHHEIVAMAMCLCLAQQLACYYDDFMDVYQDGDEFKEPV